jgi:hypothetical protein
VPAPAFASARLGAADDVLLPGGAPPPREPLPLDTGPDTMLPYVEPIITVAPPREPRFDSRKIAIGVVVLVLALGAAFTFIPHGAHHATAAPVTLTPQAPFAGIPTSLPAIVRIEAESSRHTALSVVISGAGPGGAALSLNQLGTLQPGYQWIGPSQPSTTNTMISISSQQGLDVVAVSGSNRSICAYGRWSPTAGSTYVTMDHVSTCDAATAPPTGWSTLAGGSAQDLPGVDGN